MKKFLSRLNPRLLLIHFVAIFCFIYGFKMLFYLYNIEMFDFLMKEKVPLGVKDPQAVQIYFIVIGVSGSMGALTAFIISLLISYKRKYYWINSLIAFIMIFVLYRFDLLGWKYLKGIFFLSYRLIENDYFRIIFTGITLLILGYLLFFNKKIIRFIAAGKASNQQIIETANPLD